MVEEWVVLNFDTRSERVAKRRSKTMSLHMPVVVGESKCIGLDVSKL